MKELKWNSKQNGIVLFEDYSTLPQDIQKCTILILKDRKIINNIRDINVKQWKHNVIVVSSLLFIKLINDMHLVGVDICCERVVQLV